MSTGTPTRRRRGGNRLGPGHPARGRPPRYDRCRDWGTDPERRDRHQRVRMGRAIAMAQDAGQLPPHLAAVLGRLLDASDDHLTAGWWSLRWIARAVLGQDRYDDDTTGGQRTAGRWMADLRRLGWVHREHRFIAEAGRVRATSNRWRLVIPAELRDAVLEREDHARARTQAAGAEGRRPRLVNDPRSDAAAAERRRMAQRRDGTACPACHGARWVDHPDNPDTVVPCDACSATVRAPRAP